ncbi:MAG: hypothetical protein Q9157_004445 [Trypethelium eluteriae]
MDLAESFESGDVVWSEFERFGISLSIGHWTEDDLSRFFPRSRAILMATASASTPTKKSGPASGVLPISASALHKNAGGKDASRRAAKDQGPRLKVVVRRLPPGLTASEFEAALGDEWKLGGERVDWMDYRPGKVSKEYDYPV